MFLFLVLMLSEISQNRANCIVCTPPPFVLAGGEGLNFQPNFQKGEGRLDRTSNFRGGLLGKRKVTFFRGGEGEGCNFHTKNKLKSEIFKDKKSL